MPVNRLKLSRVLNIERFSDFSEFRANEVFGLGTSTPLRPREFSLLPRHPGGDGLTVKAAALGNGFWHLGDFSMGYKRAFGEAPSETLPRGRHPFHLARGT